MSSFSTAFYKYREIHSQLEECKYFLDIHVWDWFNRNNPNNDPEDWCVEYRLLKKDNTNVLEATFTNKVCDRLSVRVLFNENGEEIS